MIVGANAGAVEPAGTSLIVTLPQLIRLAVPPCWLETIVGRMNAVPGRNCVGESMPEWRTSPPKIAPYLAQVQSAGTACELTAAKFESLPLPVSRTAAPAGRAGPLHGAAS